MPGINLGALFNASANAYVILDRQLTIVEANDAYLAVTNSRRDALIGSQFLQVFPGDPSSMSGRLLQESLARVLRDGVADHIALMPPELAEAGMVDGQRSWKISSMPLAGHDGSFEFILQHAIDVSDLVGKRGSVASDAMKGLGDLVLPERGDGYSAGATGEGQLLRALFEESPSFMAVLRGPNHQFELANAAFKQLVGREVTGRTLIEVVPNAGEQGVLDILDTVLRSGKPYAARGMSIMVPGLDGQPATERVVDIVHQPILDRTGQVEGIFVQGHDMTEQKRAEQHLARQSELLRVAQEAGGVGTFDFDVARQHVWGSGTFAVLFGLPPSSTGWPMQAILDRVVAEDHGLLVTSRERPLEELVSRAEYRIQTEDGIRWLARQGEIECDSKGRPLRVLGVVYDITARKQSEEQMRLLMEESAHRIKNTLAIVQAIISQTLRSATDLPQAREALTARLAALANAHDGLMRGSQASADILSVIESSTRLLSDVEDRFEVAGDAVILGPNAVLGLALMLHELGTNALKYGALSEPGGRVEISWTARPGPKGKIVAFSWVERDGPKVEAPERKGFGSRLLERGLAGYLGSEARVLYKQGGVVCLADIHCGVP